VGARFSLQQFSEIFQVRNPDGRPYVLIVGQAVNYWAERYLASEPELCALRPFTSEDIDFKGNRDDVRRIAAQLNLTPVFPHKVMLTALAGAIPFRIGNLKSNIEVVRSVPGVAAGAVDAFAIQAEWNRRQIRVLDPVSLLVGKLELALKMPQEKRQDVAHLKILVVCVRGFLRELLREVERGNIPARGWLGAANRLLKLAGSTQGRKAVRKFGIDWKQMLPLTEIAKSRHEKIARFFGKQLSFQK
jgi:hypothetical protein